MTEADAATARPRHYDLLGLFMSIHAFPAENDGKFMLAEVVVPKGLGAPPNHHAGEAEGFLVLEGEVEFMIDGEAQIHGAGRYVAIPDGALHAFSGASETPARVLIVNAPGKMHDSFFTGIGTPVTDGRRNPVAPDGPPDVARIVQIASAAGMTILAPQGA